ncbi:MAG: hypothetical protein M1820_004253 [Bogoriella megaspora]|nr:MAG: hypothetical protein M1820_004253 [Bogoriella megaspora]
MASSSASVAPLARLTFQDAFDRIKETVSDHDARQFQSTTLEDVRRGAIDLEARLGSRRSLQNMRRIKPLLDNLERYSSAVDVLCNGTPFLPWIWLASGFTQAFELLISAYKEIAQTLPRFDRLSSIFKTEPDFQHVLAVFYADIVEFHRRAYQFVRRRGKITLRQFVSKLNPSIGWNVFFLSSWVRFEARFKIILADLAKHSELVDKEAAAFAIAEAREWRDKWQKQISKQESDRADSQLKAAIVWFDVQRWDSEQEDELCRLSDRCQRGTCAWVFDNPKMKSWIRHGPQQNLVWMKGKPGSGKSVLCSQIIESLQENSKSKIIYHFCAYSTGDGNPCTKILRSIAAQALRAAPEASSWIFDKFISQNLTPSLAQLRILLPTLLSILPSTRIILDGLDEFEADQHKPILYLAYSEDSQISLNDEHEAITGAIQNFVDTSVQDLQNNLDEISLEDDAIAGIRRALVDKADGMFLWVQLVVSTLESIYSITEMYSAVDTLPKGLDEIYNRIWRRIEGRLDDQGRATVTQIFEWIAFGERALKKHEIQDGVTWHRENTTISEETHISRNVFDLCKPLLEDGPHDTVRFVHSSVKEYMPSNIDQRNKAKYNRYLLAYNIRFERGLVPHYDIALACTNYLLVGLTLVSPSYDEHQRLVDVGKGLHGLQIYANEFWLEHTLAYASLVSDDCDTLPQSRLLSNLRSFCQKQASIWLQRNPSERAQPKRVGLGQTESRVESFKNHEHIYPTVAGLVNFRKTSTAFALQWADGKSDESKDPTMFTSMMSNYQDLIQRLSTTDAIGGLTDTRLATFKRIYGASPFLCRIRGCLRASQGFDNERDRAEHEKTHSLSLFCNDLDCTYNKLGFASARALKKHMVECHPLSLRKAPDTLRKEPEGQTVTRQSTEEPLGDLDKSPLEDSFDFPPELVPSAKLADLGPEKEDSFALSTTSWEGG